MNADPQLRERLGRAARYVTVDAERDLDRIRGSAERRGRRRRIRTLAVAAVIGVLAVVLAWQLRPADERELTPAGVLPFGRIAYLQAQGSSRGVFDLDAVSGDVASLYDGDVSVLWADWSPDGSRLAYALEEPGPRYAIVVADADGSDQVTIVEDEDAEAAGPDLVDLSWSPDGSKIAYSGRTVERGVARRTVLIVNADGSGEPAVLEGLWAGVSWSPDGERLLVSGFPRADSREGQFDLYTMRPDGSDLVQLTDGAAQELNPSWSPDGARIVFHMGRNDYDHDVYVMDADGSAVLRLNDWEGLDVLPLWSPDGHLIAFASDRGATQAQQESNRRGEAWSGVSIYVMNADGSRVSRLLDVGDAAAIPVSWTS